MSEEPIKTKITFGLAAQVTKLKLLKPNRKMTLERQG